ncbi:MAG: pyridoxal phosphate-dependent transferase [Akkermansiaceae bacterium]|nr:pyridoxal phosphate-dependent transferase [Akkermansiaceae bacterium]
MTYDFDVPITRKGSGSIKFDRRPELDPFWVADMDFASAPEILENLHRRIDHGVFGYAQAHAALNEAVDYYLDTQRGVKVPREHITHLGGLVPALSLAGRAFCGAGESLMTCTPVYPPFINVHHDGVAGLITVDHVIVDGLYTFDWDAMEKAVTPETKIFILCNPQNPLGRVFTEEEVTRLAKFCQTHNLILVSDEIHCDLVLDPEKTPHFSALQLPEELRKITITLLSPSKTWNIAGLGYAFSVIPDDTIRRKFTAQRGHTLSEINALSYYAAEAAYQHGEPWRLQLIAYLKENRALLDSFLAEKAPQLTVVPGAATYLAWIDARGIGVENPAQYFEKEAGLFVSDGAFFGWPGWIRFNFGCTRARMLEGLEKLVAALPK